MQWELIVQEGPVENKWPTNATAGLFVFVIALEQSMQANGQAFRPAQFNAYHLQVQSLLISGQQQGRWSYMLFFAGKDDLSVYSSCCQKLQTFLAGGQPLPPAPAFMRLDMQELVKSLLSFKGEENLAALYSQGYCSNG